MYDSSTSFCCSFSHAHDFDHPHVPNDYKLAPCGHLICATCIGQSPSGMVNPIVCAHCGTSATASDLRKVFLPSPEPVVPHQGSVLKSEDTRFSASDKKVETLLRVSLQCVIDERAVERRHRLIEHTNIVSRKEKEVVMYNLLRKRMELDEAEMITEVLERKREVASAVLEKARELLEEKKRALQEKLRMSREGSSPPEEYHKKRQCYSRNDNEQSSGSPSKKRSTTSASSSSRKHRHAKPTVDKISNSFSEASSMLLKEMQVSREQKVDTKRAKLEYQVWSREQKSRDIAAEREFKRERAAEQCAHELEMLERQAKVDQELSARRQVELSMQLKELELKVAYEKVLAERLTLEKKN
ncbi:hypothetical protein BU15DRAFT_76848 [Melanogaster broomeanus]|nr:hypothetical protein BU15DRAFT_76848 [Melanogaster broomeanus]